MRGSIITILFFAFHLSSSGQAIPSKANTILVKGVSFTEICTALLDAGYSIEKKDSELQTVRTEPKKYPKYWNATYVVNIRVKDSTAYISGKFTGASGGLFKDDPIYNHTNKKGETHEKSMFGYPFLLLNEFAQSFKKEVSYQTL